MSPWRPPGASWAVPGLTASVAWGPSLGLASSRFLSFVPRISLPGSSKKQMFHPHPLCSPIPKKTQQKPFTVQSIVWSTPRQTPSWLILFPPKLTESNGYLFIYSLIIYTLSPSKKDLSASLHVLASPPKSVSISRKKITAGEVVFGFTPASAELLPDAE